MERTVINLDILTIIGLILFVVFYILVQMYIRIKWFRKFIDSIFIR